VLFAGADSGRGEADPDGEGAGDNGGGAGAGRKGAGGSAGGAFERRNYDEAMAEVRRIRKSLEEMGRMTEALAKLEAILGRAAGMGASQFLDRSR